MTDSSSKTPLIVVLIGLTVFAVIALVYMVDIDQTQDAKLPDVDVEVKGGQAPKFDVKTGKVGVTEEKVKVKVPEVDVKMKETEVTVPKIEVTPPEQTNQPKPNN